MDYFQTLSTKSSYAFETIIRIIINLQEPGAKDIETVRSYMLEYLADGSRSYSEPYFTVSEVKKKHVQGHFSHTCNRHVVPRATEVSFTESENGHMVIRGVTKHRTIDASRLEVFR